MGWYDLLEMMLASAAGAMLGFVLGVGEVLVFAAQAGWVAIVRAFLPLIEWADEQWSDLGIADNALLRMGVTGVVGLVLAMLLTLFAALVIGHPELVCYFGIVLGFCLFVGLMADPNKDWSFPQFPWLGKKGGPDIPINL